MAYHLTHRHAPLAGSIAGLLAISMFALVLPARAQTPEQRLKRPAVEAIHDATTLREVVVTAAEPRAYLQPTATTATRTDVPVLDTPVSIQVIPEQVIKDQAVTRLRDVYSNVSGVQPALTSGNVSTLESPIIRGFPVFTIYRDGFLVGSGVAPVSLANVQRIEVLKGPGSVLYGLGEPGGILNISTKRPQSTPFHAIELFAGSYDYYEAQFDFTGPLLTRGGAGSAGSELDPKSGKQMLSGGADEPVLLYRLSGSYSDSDSFRDFVATERFFIAPSLTWLPAPGTQIDFDLSYSYDRFIWDDGVFLDEEGDRLTPKERYAGEPNFFSSRDEWFAGLSLRQEITDWWKLRAQVSFHSIETRLNAWRAGSPFRDPTTGELLITRRYDASVPRGMEYSAIIDSTFQFDLWGGKHTLLAGVDFKHEPRQNNTQNGFRGNVSSVLSLEDPHYGASIPGDQRFIESNNERTLFGVYLQDQIALLDDRLHLLLGGRFDYVEQRTQFIEPAFGFNFRSDRIDDRAFTFRAGALYQVASWLHPYVSYTQGFNPQSPFVIGEGLDPETSEQYEAGVKMPLLGEKLVLTAAAYQLTKENVATDLDGDGISEVSGKLRSSGFEFDLVGQLAPGLSVIANYAYTDTEVLQSDFLGIGSRFQSVPLHSGALYAKYEFQPGSALHGWAVGSGIVLVDERVADTAGQAHVGGYVRWDAFVRYRHEFADRRALTAQVNFKNILDEDYIESVSGNFAYPGAPFSVIGSVRFEF
jgi:iron complex outermembrane receptor protein